jgi:hypothetical protein
VPCKSSTLNVHYGSGHEKCYAGHGTKVVRIPNVHVVTTGNNRGSLVFTQRNIVIRRINFTPHETLKFTDGPRVELDIVTIA